MEEIILHNHAFLAWALDNQSQFLLSIEKRPFGLEVWIVKFAMDRKNKMMCTMMQKSTTAINYDFSASVLLLSVLTLLLVSLLTVLVVIC